MNLAAKRVSIEEFGAKEGADCTSALQAAIDLIGREGPPGGVVVIPTGCWECGSVVLRSGVNLHLQMGAALHASADERLYSFYTHGYASRMDVFPRRALIFGFGLRDVAITGEGVIESGGRHATFQDGVGDSPDRPYGLHLVDCERIRIEGLTWRDSAYWMMRFFQCREVTLRGLQIRHVNGLLSEGMQITADPDDPREPVVMLAEKNGM